MANSSVSRTYGEVWKACHKKSNKLLAIKKIRVDRDTTDLLREISIMKKCVSQWVVRYYGNYFKDDVMWVSNKFNIVPLELNICGFEDWLFIAEN